MMVSTGGSLRLFLCSNINRQFYTDTLDTANDFQPGFQGHAGARSAVRQSPNTTCFQYLRNSG